LDIDYKRTFIVLPSYAGVKWWSVAPWILRVCYTSVRLKLLKLRQKKPLRFWGKEEDCSSVPVVT